LHTNKNVAGISFLFHPEEEKNVQSNDHSGAFDPNSFQNSKSYTKFGLIYKDITRFGYGGKSKSVYCATFIKIGNFLKDDILLF
jgi:hypothetical protein